PAAGDDAFLDRRPRRVQRVLDARLLLLQLGLGRGANVDLRHAAGQFRQAFLENLAGGVAQINVGAATEAELKEKKARIEDALHATRAAVEEGVVAGGG